MRGGGFNDVRRKTDDRSPRGPERRPPSGRRRFRRPRLSRHDRLWRGPGRFGDRRHGRGGGHASRGDRGRPVDPVHGDGGAPRRGRRGELETGGENILRRLRQGRRPGRDAPGDLLLQRRAGLVGGVPAARFVRPAAHPHQHAGLHAAPALPDGGQSRQPHRPQRSRLHRPAGNRLFVRRSRRSAIATSGASTRTRGSSSSSSSAILPPTAAGTRRNSCLANPTARRAPACWRGCCTRTGSNSTA